MEEIFIQFYRDLPRMRISNAVNEVDISISNYWYLPLHGIKTPA